MRVPDVRPERWQALDRGRQIPPICVKDRHAKYQRTCHLPTSPPRPSPSLGTPSTKRAPRAQNEACQRNKTPQPRVAPPGRGSPTPGRKIPPLVANPTPCAAIRGLGARGGAEQPRGPIVERGSERLVVCPEPLMGPVVCSSGPWATRGPRRRPRPGVISGVSSAKGLLQTPLSLATMR